jgi:hypothetical protein
MNKEELCEKIRKIYPGIGRCGIDLNVNYDDEINQWCVSLIRDGKELKTYLETGDAELCIDDKQCLSLGIEITQLKDSIDRMPAY